MTRMILWLLVLLPVLFSEKLFGLPARVAQSRFTGVAILRVAETAGLDTGGWLAFISRAPFSLSDVLVAAGVGSAFFLGASFAANAMKMVSSNDNSSTGDGSAASQPSKASLRLEAVIQRRR